MPAETAMKGFQRCRTERVSRSSALPDVWERRVRGCVADTRLLVRMSGRLYSRTYDRRHKTGRKLTGRLQAAKQFHQMFFPPKRLKAPVFSTEVARFGLFSRPRESLVEAATKGFGAPSDAFCAQLRDAAPFRHRESPARVAAPVFDLPRPRRRLGLRHPPGVPTTPHR